jgi:hypothetical protein
MVLEANIVIFYDIESKEGGVMVVKGIGGLVIVSVHSEIGKFGSDQGARKI